MKFCVNCGHHRRERNMWGFPVHWCHNVAPDTVTGDEEYQACRELREAADLCGPDGRWFVPKEETK